MNTYTIKKVLWTRNEKNPTILAEDTLENQFSFSSNADAEHSFDVDKDSFSKVKKVGVFDWIHINPSGLVVIDYLEKNNSKNE